MLGQTEQLRTETLIPHLSKGSSEILDNLYNKTKVEENIMYKNHTVVFSCGGYSAGQQEPKEFYYEVILGE